ncbi:hypothetical protein BGW36DRAFT_432967 [Talaromyces proteolyticus]|uniref:SigF-like NTF2-like domain-containing protein n=1 Tax=Talaromyces proteolyticus TaxID=1131652 RepID=A0AAD4KJY8_9EURO|nr:uncharacterized protein BGW36DRAFT_432967 [Talaromyces proteolyticus]KAH8690004.1 hypothetical protein BGW36DRAFT_432967 [Talaromyces proteolyticus]
MEDPVRDIPIVIKLLTESPPTIQKYTIEKFFIPNASFSHPFCRTWSFNNSRWLVQMIYRFYKIMSPRIKLDVKSIAFDEEHLKLYVTIQQLFSIFIIPFYSAPVTLTTVLTLTDNPNEYRGHYDFSTPSNKKQDDGKNEPKKYWISSQEDLYQTNEFVKFFLPFGIGVFAVFVWHLFATAGCVAGAILLWPVSWMEQTWALEKGEPQVTEGNIVDASGAMARFIVEEATGLVNGVRESVQERTKEIE